MKKLKSIWSWLAAMLRPLTEEEKKQAGIIKASDYQISQQMEKFREEIKQRRQKR